MTGAPPAQLFSTARTAERVVVSWLDDIGVHVVDHPATPTFSETGKAIRPDLAMRLGTGGPTFTLADGAVDVLGEVKIQNEPGTAIHKLIETIDRYARLFDIHGIPTVIFYQLDIEAVGQVEIDRLAMLADANLVGFVEAGSLTAPQLRALVLDLMRRRNELVGSTEDLYELLRGLALPVERLVALARMATSTSAPSPVPVGSDLLW